MSNIKKFTGHNRKKEEIIDFMDLPKVLASLKDLYEIKVVDDNGNPYVFRLTKTAGADSSDDLEGETLSIDFNEIKEIFIKLTDDQRKIVMHIFHLYKNKNNKSDQSSGEEVDSPRIILQGPAGTGKSTIIDFIEKLITWEANQTSDNPQHLKVIKCAFTGKAASNIDGTTLNHLFSIPVPVHKTRKLPKKRLASKVELLKDCIVFICDEISMVGQKTMTSVNSRLQQIFQNEKLYGNRFVLLVGDLYQIDPVMQRPIYPDSEYWTCCEFYELTKVIRQEDERFINALNHFRTAQMTKEDVELLKSREIHDLNVVPDSVVHLFYQNKNVDEYNTSKLDNSTGKEETVNAFEDSENWKPSCLRVKIGIRYMITYNIDVSDGLANGTIGVVKEFEYNSAGNVCAIWMEFCSDRIGKKTRLAYANKHNKSFESWVPITQSKIVVQLISDKKTSRTVANMFPLRAAEAITVHKSQGQTYHEGACIHITNDQHDKLRTDKSLQYVALTRVKRLEDLYIKGIIDFTIANSQKFVRIENELNRLRNERKVKPAFETFQNETSDIIVYLNSGLTFNDHHEFISADKWYNNASLLILTETNTIDTDNIEIPDFEVAFRSDDETAVRSGGGIICYKKPTRSVDEVVSFMSNDEDKICLTLLLYDNFLYIVTGVKGDLSDDEFMEAIEIFISKYVRENGCIFLIGDLNTDQDGPSMIDFLDKWAIKKKTSCDILTTCDAVFTRYFDLDQSDFGFYEYIPSPHKSIYVKIPSKSELLNENNSQYEEYSSSSQGFEIQEEMDTD